MPGPPYNLRHPEATLEEVPFATDEGPDVRIPLAAIVTGEDHQRVFAGTPPRVDDPTDSGIEDLHHLSVDTRAAALHDLCGIRLPLPRCRRDGGGRPRPMRRVVVQAEEIGLVWPDGGLYVRQRTLA